MVHSPGILPCEYARLLRGSLLAHIVRASLRPFLRIRATPKGADLGGIPCRRSQKQKANSNERSLPRPLLISLLICLLILDSP
ncbi:MAG TPA: hypothetical protein VFN13_10545 [Rudaea sp.]|nr:hypothetical protein [Rudaea sp.]